MMSSENRKSCETTTTTDQPCSISSPPGTVTHAVAMASASIMTKNNRKNDNSGSLKSSKERSSMGRDKDNLRKEEDRPIIITSINEKVEEQEEVLKLRRLVQILQREKEHLQGQCSTFERAGMQVTAHNRDLQKTMNSLQAMAQALQDENRSLAEKLMDATSHMKQVVMPNYQWYYHRAHSLEMNYRILLNNHHHLRSYCDSLLMEMKLSSEQGNCGAGPNIGAAAAQSQESTGTQKGTIGEEEKSEPIPSMEAKSMHRPFLQPRQEHSQFGENEMERNPKNFKHDVVSVTASNEKSTDDTVSRRCRPSLQRPSSNHVSSSSAVAVVEPITATPKPTSYVGSTDIPKACSMERGFKVNPTSNAPVTHQNDRHVTPSPQISYQLVSNNGTKQPPLPTLTQVVPSHPYLDTVSHHNVTNQRIAVLNESVEGCALPSFPAVPQTSLHAASYQTNPNQSENHVAGQKRRIISSGRGGSHCVTGSKKKKPCVTV